MGIGSGDLPGGSGSGGGIGSLVKGAVNLLSTLNSLTLETELSYDEVMKYFIDHQGDDKRIVKGAMIRTETEKGHLFLTQVFLDEKDEMVCNEKGEPLGIKTEAIGLDAELLKVFKDNNTVIVG
jgi:hypothetical protein